MLSKNCPAGHRVIDPDTSWQGVFLPRNELLRESRISWPKVDQLANRHRHNQREMS